MSWSSQALRLAAALEVALASHPKDEPNATLHREIYGLDGTYAEGRKSLGCG
jgi:hypothetical protein